MKRPWQIWFLFLVCLCFVITALGWLSAKVIELDKAEIAANDETLEAERLAAEAFREAELARRKADLQDQVSNALWRMDWTLTPLVAQEAARPYFVYQAFYAADGNTPGVKGSPPPPVNLLPSPLLVRPSEFVHVHFQLERGDQWLSPQNPMGKQATSAAANFGASPESIQSSVELLAILRQSVKHEELLKRLPEQLIPPSNLAYQDTTNPNLNWNYNRNNDRYIGNSGVQVFNDNGIEQIAQQIEANRGPAQQAERAANGPAQSTEVQQQAQSRSRRRSASRDQWRLDYQQQQLDLSTRSGLVWQSRMRGINAYAQSSALQQRAGNSQVLGGMPVQLAKEGVSRPLWIDDKLLLARRTLIGNRTVIQGCWLDWTKLKAALLAGVEELSLEGLELVPVRGSDNISIGRMLATIPVALEIREPQLADVPSDESLNTASKRTRWTAIRASLGLAWVCLCVGTVAVAVLLQGVIKLSERRGAFVSAVTHELRTPLTTFRMYAEMLSEGMVPSQDQRQKYLDTLRVEADRLSHLVENVLQYARLERHGRKRRHERIVTSDLVDRMHQRLADRARQADLEISLEMDQETGKTELNTDPSAVEQILFNLVDNACKYAITAEERTIQWQIAQSQSELQITVRDHGPGIDEKAARRLFRPFSKSVHDAADSAPGVGLGLALSRRLAQALGGRLSYHQRADGGAAFTLYLPT